MRHCVTIDRLIRFWSSFRWMVIIIAIAFIGHKPFLFPRPLIRGGCCARRNERIRIRGPPYTAFGKGLSKAEEVRPKLNFLRTIKRDRDNMTKYDSKADTLEHIRKVNEYLGVFAMELIKRGMAHDDSKLGPIEKPHFDRETPLLKELTYGSPEYKESLGRLQDALKHHYATNPHHPEFYDNGVSGMNLMDLVEMFCDWKAASERNKGGKLNLEISFERFKFSKQLASIFRNTADKLNYNVVEAEPYDNPLFEKGTVETVSEPGKTPYVKLGFPDLDTAHKFVDWLIANK